jgi:hypothetical protein
MNPAQSLASEQGVLASEQSVLASKQSVLASKQRVLKTVIGLKGSTH